MDKTIDKKPLFSVIVPVYNVKSYLRGAIHSLISQKIMNSEFILVDDGSTDGSSLIIEEMLSLDSRLIALRQENKGYGAAMNLGLKHARGRYIGILEPDDLYTKDCLSRVSEIIDSLEPEAPEIIKGNFTLYYGEDLPEEAYLIRSACFDSVCNLQSNPELIINNPSIWSAFYKRDFLEERKILFKETPGASFQDLPFFWQSMTRADSIYLCRDIFYRYRQDNPGSSINKTLHYKRILNIYEELLPEIKMTPWTFGKISEDLYWNYQRIAKNHRRKFLNGAAKLLKSEKADLSMIESKKVKLFMLRILIRK